MGPRLRCDSKAQSRGFLDLSTDIWKPNWYRGPRAAKDPCRTPCKSKSDHPSRNPGNVLTVPQIHLHGHDFALLQQSSVPLNLSGSTNLNLNFGNPPRRDVVLLPANGFVVIAFKSDNPGSWLIHCHIAWHASSGLAMQILEQQDALLKQMTPARLAPVEKGCATWDKWFSNPNNLWDANVTFFQDDSGI